MRKLLLCVLLGISLKAGATNMTNYPAIGVAPGWYLVWLGDVGTKTNYNITVSNLTLQISVSVQTNNNVFTGSNCFVGPVTILNGNPLTTLGTLRLLDTITYSNAPTGTPVNTTAPVIWVRETNNGAVYYAPKYQ